MGRESHHGDTESTEKRRGEDDEWNLFRILSPPVFSVLSVSPW
jgi:hypothetical protein